MNPQLLSSAPIHLVITGVGLVVLSLLFLIGFGMPAWRQDRLLKKVLQTLEGDDLKDARDPQSLDQAFPTEGEVAHLWREYKKTLYALPGEVTDGIARVRWASTAPAEIIWNSQLAVDQRVGAEFFKHLPGIFTGLGIIGTFFGLIAGLGEFQITSEAEAVRKNLDSLMHAVKEAFQVSAVAITLAIIITFVEKMVLTRLYGTVDAIASSLDRRFQAAVAEKFLELTAVHTEEAATQLKHLKGELLNDLRPILHELSDKQTETLERLAASMQERFSETTRAQIEAARDNSQAMGATISGAITGSLEGPLNDIKSAVQKASSDQSDAAVKMLQDVMTSFSQKLNDLFGGQISGINELNQRTAQTMQDAVTKLNELVAALQDAGKKSSDSMAEQMAKAMAEMESRQATITQNTQALVDQLRQAIEQSQKTTSDGVRSSTEEMAKRMAEAIEKMEQRQEGINERTREFVDQIKALVANSQTETSAKVQSTLQSLGEQLGAMLKEFQSAQQAVIAAGQAREEQAAKSKDEAVNAISSRTDEFVGEVGKLLSESNDQSRNILQATTDAMGSQVAALLKEFQDAQREAIEAGRQREQETSERTQTSVSGLMGSVETLVQQIAMASTKMEESIAALRATTTAAISSLSEGASQVNTASRNFTTASDKVTSAMNQASTVTTNLTDLTTSLTVAASSLQQGVQDYKVHRESVGKLVSDLNGLVANAKTDVSITSDVLRRIEATAKELTKAQTQMEQFMAGVSTVLGKAHEAFREAMLKTVRENNHEFQTKLSSAVAMLGVSITELDDVLSTAGTRGRNK
jgi:chromosome segregation ATPase